MKSQREFEKNVNLMMALADIYMLSVIEPSDDVSIYDMSKEKLCHIIRDIRYRALCARRLFLSGDRLPTGQRKRRIRLDVNVPNIDPECLSRSDWEEYNKKRVGDGRDSIEYRSFYTDKQGVLRDADTGEIVERI